MNLAPWFSFAGSASGSRLGFAASACLIGLIGCGGSTYSLGTVGGDAGKEGGLNHTCFSEDPCEGGSGFSQDAGTSVNSGSGGEDNSGPVFVDSGVAEVGSPSCTVTTIACPGGATGYSCSCPPGDSCFEGNPGNQLPALSCTSGAMNGSYCCIPFSGSTATCIPFPDFPCDSNSYAYQCFPGSFPWNIDSKLSCGTSFPDSNGDNDFCCALP
jgi:hypothetical protein